MTDKPLPPPTPPSVNPPSLSTPPLDVPTAPAPTASQPPPLSPSPLSSPQIPVAAESVKPPPSTLSAAPPPLSAPSPLPQGVPQSVFSPPPPIPNMPPARSFSPPPPSTIPAPMPGMSGQTGAGSAPPKPPAAAVTQINKPGDKSSPNPMFAKASKSPPKLILAVVGGLLLIGALVFAAYRLLGNQTSSVTPDSTGGKTGTTAPTKQITLTYWGLWEPRDVMTEVLKDFEQTHPGVLVNYVKQSPVDYRERLQTGITSGQGPDVFRYHASWVPMLKTELAPLPASVMSSSDFQKTFFPVAAQQLTNNGQYVGVPLMYDGLLLFYNKEIFRTANANPPKTWAELRELAVKLTVKSSTGIERGGAALGNASNVEHFSDIIGLLMLQNGADPADPTSRAAVDALKFYTNFISTDQVWSEELPSSTAAFARGEVAMMLAPSWRAHDVLALNPELEFGMVSAPTLADKNITWASYWAEGVSMQSKNKNEAWELLKYMSSAEVMQKMYGDQSQIRAFGEPYSRVDLAKELAGDEYLSALMTDAQDAQGWYLNSFTHDNGINDQIIKYYRDAVNAVLTSGKSADEAMATVSQGTTQVLRQYGMTTSTSSP